MPARLKLHGLPLLAVAALSAAAAAPAPPPVRGIDSAGYTAMLASHKGRVVVVNMWATWCDPCREEFPHFVRLHREMAARGVEVAAVSMDQETALEEGVVPFLKAQGVTFSAYIRDAGGAKRETDEDFINAVDREWSGALPATFVYDRDGKPAKRISGSTTFDDLKRIVEPLLSAGR